MIPPSACVFSYASLGRNPDTAVRYHNTQARESLRGAICLGCWGKLGICACHYCIVSILRESQVRTSVQGPVQIPVHTLGMRRFPVHFLACAGVFPHPYNKLVAFRKVSVRARRRSAVRTHRLQERAVILSGDSVP